MLSIAIMCHNKMRRNDYFDWFISHYLYILSCSFISLFKRVRNNYFYTYRQFGCDQEMPRLNEQMQAKFEES